MKKLQKKKQLLTALLARDFPCFFFLFLQSCALESFFASELFSRNEIASLKILLERRKFYLFYFSLRLFFSFFSDPRLGCQEFTELGGIAHSFSATRKPT
jgi:hypothetical protein